MLIQTSTTMALTRKLAVSALGAGIMMAAVPSMAAPSEKPTEFVKRISDNLMERLVKERVAYRKDPRLLNKIVDDNIRPYIDFDGFTRGVLGRYARQATPAQIKRFEGNLEDSLINGYAKYLGQYNNQNYTILPYKPSNNPNNAIVSTNFKTDTGKSVPVSYQLVNENDNWRVRNVKVAGIDIGLTFRKQFANTVEKNRNNLDAAINNFVPIAQQ